MAASALGHSQTAVARYTGYRGFLELMKKISLVLAGSLLVFCCLNVVPVRAQVQVPAAATSSVAQRSKDLSKLFAEIWEDKLKHSPEFASFLGDKRYNDQLSDYSTQAVNAALSRGRAFIQRLSEIDTTGLPEQERLSAELMLRSLIDDQEGAKFKEWQMPVNLMSMTLPSSPSTSVTLTLSPQRGLKPSALWVGCSSTPK